MDKNAKNVLLRRAFKFYVSKGRNMCYNQNVSTTNGPRRDRGAHSEKEETILNNENVQEILDRLKNLVHEGNVRRVLVKHNGEIIVNVPLTAGVLGGALALKAPLLLAATAVAAFGFGCTVELVKDDGDVIVTDFTEADE